VVLTNPPCWIVDGKNSYIDFLRHDLPQNENIKLPLCRSEWNSLLSLCHFYFNNGSHLILICSGIHCKNNNNTVTNIWITTDLDPCHSAIIFFHPLFIISYNYTMNWAMIFCIIWIIFILWITFLFQNLNGRSNCSKWFLYEN
jgi:hypothetical protein